MEKVWEIRNPDEYFRNGTRKRKTVTSGAVAPDSNPARAYTLSLLFWGTGQSYNEERGKGLLLQIFMIAVIVALIFLLIFWTSSVQFLRTHGVSDSRLFLIAELLFFCTLIFWLAVAGHAYHGAAKKRTTRFAGVQNHIYPFLSSILIPGWGQFLNGQPLKGSFFSAFAVFGLFAFVSIPAVLLAWPFFRPSEERFIIESIFAITVLYAPMMPFVWLVSSYDALKISLDELKKESLWERIKSANNRRRTQGWVRGVFPQFKSTMVLIFFLLVLSSLIAKTVSLGFYGDLLNAVRQDLHSRGMTVLPELLTTLLAFLP
jgi:TM2 domain-containing membrane protein YozV